MRVPLVAGGALSLLVLISCGGGSGYGGPTQTPTTPSPSPSGSGTISILGDRGAQSFTPNPGTGGTDQIFVWRNNDGVAHRIVVNDTVLDTGNIPPGASSSPLQLPTAGANYHCSIHPGMIGSVASSGGGAPPPCTGIYC
jgi:plastocyanin